jgi:hypothetical protein
LSTAENIRKHFASLSAELYFNQPRNVAFHNLCVNTVLPPTVRTLLGLGLNFCLRRTMSSGPTAIDTARFKRDAHTRMFFANETAPFDTKLFHRSNWQPDPIDVPLEFRGRISELTSELSNLFATPQRCQSNLTENQHWVLDWLRNNPMLVVFATDKNLGPAITERKVYIERALSEHLLDTTTYRQLSAVQFHQAIDVIRSLIQRFIDTFFPDTRPVTAKTISDRKFLIRSYNAAAATDTPYNYFYLLAKVHKSPWVTRPIVSCSGSLLHGLGRWVDVELQRVVRHLPYFLKSSVDLALDLAALELLPANTRFFTCDAKSMYTNIDTDHALSEIECFLRGSDVAATEGINVDALVAGLRLIMEHNVFVFGDTYWRQLSGTAMGTPPAPMYATLYFAIHEDRIIRRFPQLRLYRRYIDDGFGIWIPNGTASDTKVWTEFRNEFGIYGKLSWTFTPLQRSVDFLDVTIALDGTGRIVTTLFEKALNLYLYLPPHSAHPPGGLKGLIFGFFYRLQRLVSQPSDRAAFVVKLRARLFARGYPTAVIDPIVAEAKARCAAPGATHTDLSDIRPLYLHVDFHPADPSARVIQRVIRRRLLAPPNDTPLHELRNCDGARLGIRRVIIAYHRPRNLKNHLSPRRLDPTGIPVSEVLDNFRLASKSG